MPKAARLSPQLSENLSAELNFIKAYISPQGAFRYTRAPFLQTGTFDSEVWTIACQHSYVIDWRTNVGKYGGDLISPKNERLWRLFRSWLCVQAHPDRGSPLIGSATLYNRLRCVGTLIDYFLLHADDLGISQDGFQAVSANDITALVGLINAGPIGTHLYAWPDRLAKYLRNAIAVAPPNRLTDLVHSTPALRSPVPPARLTDLSEDEILLARAVLWDKGLYIRTTRSNRSSTLKPDSSALQQLAFPIRLTHARSMPMADELLLVQRPPRRREHTASPVRCTGSARTSGSIGVYASVIDSLTLLRRDGLTTPDVSVISGSASYQTIPAGRFTSLPVDVVLNALRQAITFLVERGNDLVASYLSVVDAAIDEETTIRELDKQYGISRHVSVGACRIGILRWSTSSASKGQAAPSKLAGSPHELLRGGAGLYEQLRVMFGACQIVIGTVGARREGEMRELQAGEALDELRTSLVFVARKSGIGELRQQSRIPLPPVAVDCIDLLERLHFGLVERGVISSAPALFSFPRKNGPPALVSASTTNYAESLDYFCDWAELPLDSQGRRPYIRQHQLRRFFAMLFFWGHGLNQLDTLRGFLGHVDAKHAYHYITESTPGGVLLSVKANFLLDQVRNDSANSALISLLSHQFGTRDFHLVPSEDLETYIEHLIEGGAVKVEPVFVDKGRKYKILVTVRDVD